MCIYMYNIIYMYMHTIFSSRAFSSSHVYVHLDEGPIAVPTLVKMSNTGHFLSAWGEGLFYMPHGLTIDGHGRFWVTDVAMHQVQYMKLPGSSVLSFLRVLS